MTDRRQQSHLLLVTGMSGAGKSTALDVLEDFGWDVVDNLPADLLPAFVSGGRQCRVGPVAVGMDVRSRGFDPIALPAALAGIDGVRPEILFLDCMGSELIRRFNETRRRHPLAPDMPAEEGIARERNWIAPLRGIADSVIDTTDTSPVELREELRRRYAARGGTPVLTVMSFGYSRGTLRTADLVFDMRFLDNPHWVDELRPLTGQDAAVRDYLRKDESWDGAMASVESLLKDWIPRYWASGKTYLTIAFGCTGGRHRSVCAAVEMAERLAKAGFQPNLRHRDLTSRASDAIEDPAWHADGGVEGNLKA